MSETSFAAPFFAYVDPVGVVDIDVTGFAFVLPYQKDVSRIQITHLGDVLTDVDVTTKLLHDAIDSIPDEGFVDYPPEFRHNPPSEKLRKVLHNKIEEVQEKIEQNDIQGAINKLVHDIRVRLLNWLIGYQKSDPTQLSKDDILNLVDRFQGSVCYCDATAEPFSTLFFLLNTRHEVRYQKTPSITRNAKSTPCDCCNPDIVGPPKKRKCNGNP